MKSGYKGALLDLDRKSRESVPSRRSRLSREWIALAGRLGHDAEAFGEEDDPRPWLRPLPLWLAAVQAGGMPLLRAVEKRRCLLFHQPLRLTRFLSIGYVTPPSGLLEELAWLRELDVRQVVVPLDQDATDLQQVKALAAIQNLRSEDVRVAGVLRPKRGAAAEPDTWHQFCHWILSQAGWQLENAQLADGLDSHIREAKDAAAFAKLFTHVPRLRRDYPGVALLAPCLERFDLPLPVRALCRLLPEGYAWDGVCMRAPAWQALESVGRDDLFLQRLVLAGAVAGRPGFAGGKVQVAFPPPPSGCEGAAEERVAGSVVRRAVLAATSGVADRVVVGMDPALPVASRQIISIAVRELVEQLEGARFVRRVRVGDAGRDFVLEFARTGKPPVLVAWTDGEPRPVSVPFRLASAGDYLRRSVPLLPHPRIRLTRNMAYFVREGL